MAHYPEPKLAVIYIAAMCGSNPGPLMFMGENHIAYQISDQQYLKCKEWLAAQGYEPTTANDVDGSVLGIRTTIRGWEIDKHRSIVLQMSTRRKGKTDEFITVYQIRLKDFTP